MRPNSQNRHKSGPETWKHTHTGHHYGHYRLRVITATVDGKGPMYWLYDHRTNCRTWWDGNRHADGTPKTKYEFGAPVRDLRQAKRRVERLVADEKVGR